MEKLKEKIVYMMSEISLKREFRNHIIKLMSKYKKTDKLIPDSELLAILLNATLTNEVIYIRALVNKCKKNISPRSLELYEQYIELTKNGELVLNLDEQNKKYIDDSNAIVDCTSSDLYDNEKGLYAFDYIVQNGDTIDSLFKKFKLVIDKQDIDLESIIEGDVITLYTDNDTLAEYQQAIFEYINSGKSNKKGK